MAPLPRAAGETLALVGAAVIAFTSVLPYWAAIEPQQSSDLVIISGSTRFPVWRAYPVAVLLGVGLSWVILAVGLAQLVRGRSRVAPIQLYVAGGAVILVLLLYGVWEGPQRLVDDPLFGGALIAEPTERPVSFAFERGPLLYVGLAAAATIVIGGVFAHISERRSHPLQNEEVA